ncbi:dehydrogenase [Mycobacterium tuberculosis]|nr:dehydrogenase [Mycobacterium tuberculosis]
MTTAVVVGAGPNGLAAAIHLARHGVDVQVLEARDTIGGGARSGELTVPGVIHDHCSAFHPLGVGSPFWAAIDLQRYGLTWKWPDVDCAHPLDDGTAGVLYRSIEATAAGLGPDGKRWQRALFGGAAAHVYTRLDRPLTASLGLMILASGHRHGWPVARGGSGSITKALAAALDAYGGTVATGVTVTSRRDIPDADIVMLDLSPAAVLGIYGDVMPTRINRSYRRYRAGSSAFKVDFAIEGDVGWTNPDCRRAGTVHLGGTFAEIADTERQRAQGTMVQRPFVLVGQQYLADPSRSVGNINPIWAYAHVPFGYTGDATAAVIDQIERFAPGFRDRIVATVSTSTTELQTYNRNFIGGDIIGGANDRLQVIFRPRVAVDPYAIGVPGVYLCSQSAPPGAGIHGLCGYHAAESALRWLRKRR